MNFPLCILCICILALAKGSAFERHRLLETTSVPEPPTSAPSRRPELSSGTLPPWPVPSEKEVEVSCGNSHTCAVWKGYGVKCWGHNQLGALGYGDQYRRGDIENTMSSHLAFVSFGSDDFIPVSVHSGNGATCAGSEEREVRCWGDNIAGLGTTSLTLTPHHVDLGPSFDHAVHTLVFRAKGGAVLDETNTRLKMWGNNDDWQLGYERVGLPADSRVIGDVSTEMGQQLPELSLGSNIEIVQVDIGERHSCAIVRKLQKNNPRNKKRTQLKCWGINGSGELGVGDFELRAGQLMGDNLKATKLGKYFHPKQVSVGEGFTCVVSDKGRIKCFGTNYNGQLGLGSGVKNIGNLKRHMGRNLESVDLGTNFIAKEVHCGRDFACALSTTRKIKCWGENYWGQLGLGDTENRGRHPADMGDHLPFVQLGSEFIPKQLSVGYEHSCAVSIDNKIKCWGSNILGQLGLEDDLMRGDFPNQMGDNLPEVQVF